MAQYADSLGMHAYGTGSSLADYGPTVLRLALAAVFIAHGAQTLFGAQPGASLELLTTAAAVVEFAGGILLVLGWFTTPAALGLTILVLLGIWKSDLGSLLNGPYELTLASLGGLICLALTGPGAHSIDRSRAESAASRAAGRARLRGKM